MNTVLFLTPEEKKTPASSTNLENSKKFQCSKKMVNSPRKFLKISNILI